MTIDIQDHEDNIEADRIDDEELEYIGGGMRVQHFELDHNEWPERAQDQLNFDEHAFIGLPQQSVPVFAHPDVEPYTADKNYFVPGVLPDGSYVEFSYYLQGCWCPGAEDYLWET